jgi:hypothetical protein
MEFDIDNPSSKNVNNIENNNMSKTILIQWWTTKIRLLKFLPC